MDSVPKAKFLSLEGLRGVLAVLVCMGHLGLNTIASTVGVTVHFGLAVDIFFALSGFVLCHSNYFGRRSLQRFILGRFARLYPLHLLTLIGMAFLLPALGTFYSSTEFIESLTLTQNIGLPPNTLALNFPAWSISVEVWVSILFFFTLGDKRLRFRLPSLIIVMLAPALLFPSYITGDARNALYIFNFGIMRGIAGFSAGAVAFLLYDAFAREWKFATQTIYTMLALLAGFFFLDHWYYGLPTVFYAVLIAALMALATNDQATLLSTRPLVFLGTISYSVYLLHIPVYALLSLVFGDAAVRGPNKFLVLTVVLIVGWLSYRWIEQPAQKRLLERKSVRH